MENKYPEHEKIDAKVLALNDELIEHLASNGYSIVKMKNVNYYTGSIEFINWNKYRFMYFGCDIKELEVERNAMLAEYRKNE